MQAYYTRHGFLSSFAFSSRDNEAVLIEDSILLRNLFFLGSIMQLLWLQERKKSNQKKERIPYTTYKV